MTSDIPNRIPRLFSERRLRHEPRDEHNPRSRRPVEALGTDVRLQMEEKYRRDPQGFHASLIYQGFWLMAAQLKTDYEAGRL